MPINLKCMIDKWLYKGQISQEEYDAVIKKLAGHNKQIREEVVDLIDRHLWNYSHEVWEDFKPVLEQLKGEEEMKAMFIYEDGIQIRTETKQDADYRYNKIKKCEHCDGKGLIQIAPNVKGLKKCPYCGGIDGIIKGEE